MSAPAPDERIGLWFSTLSGWNVCAPDDPKARVTYRIEGERAADARRDADGIYVRGGAIHADDCPHQQPERGRAQ